MKKQQTAAELFDLKLVGRDSGGFGILVDGKEMLLPRGQVFTTPSKSYAEFVLKTLGDGGPEHFDGNRTLVCHACTLFIDFSTGFVAPEDESVREFEKNGAYSGEWDPVHNLSSGLELAEQLGRLAPYQEFCADRGIQRYRWVDDFTDTPEVKGDWKGLLKIKNAPPEAFLYFEVLEREFGTLSLAQRAVMRTYHTYCDSYLGRPFVLPLLLVKGLCSPREFAEGFLASLHAIPGVMGDVSQNQYNQERRKIERDAKRAMLFLQKH